MKTFDVWMKIKKENVMEHYPQFMFESSYKLYCEKYIELDNKKFDNSLDFEINKVEKENLY